MPAHRADLANGKLMFTIGGCINCHKPAKDQANANADLPSGVAPPKTPLRVRYPPNLTPDIEAGSGRWTDLADRDRRSGSWAAPRRRADRHWHSPGPWPACGS